MGSILKKLLSKKLVGLMFFLIFFRNHLFAQTDFKKYTAAKFPDRVNITFNGETSSSFAVTWRTDSTMLEPKVEIALAVDSSTGKPDLEMPESSTFNANSEELIMEHLKSLHHSYTFQNLQPETLYAFRVGEEGFWSEWFHYRTASKEHKPFSFIYLGDAQNNIKSMWSRTIRQAFADQPTASFILHAGDLINRQNEWEWDEWFYAGSFIHSMIPVVPVTGNHEHPKTEDGRRVLMPNWVQQFTLPGNGPASSEETDYFIDYQGVRIIVLNSTLFQDNENYREEQVKWLNKILSNNPNQWTLISYHHPMSNGVLVEELKPLLEKYDVDLAMQGHVHSYSRGITWNGTAYKSGPMYTVSVSGPKFYDLNELNGFDMMRSGEHMQLYQIINIDNNRLSYKAYTTTGKLYDEFKIVKKKGKKKFVNLLKD